MISQFQAKPSLVAVQMGEEKYLVDKTFITNAAHAALLAADRLDPIHPQHAATTGRAFFITDADPRPFWDLFRGLWAAVSPHAVAAPTWKMGTAALLVFGGAKHAVDLLRGKPAETWQKVTFMCASRSYDISLAREVLGYAPLVSHDEGIRLTAEVRTIFRVRV